MKKKILSFLCLTAILLTLFMTAPAAAKNDDADSFPPRYDPRELGLVTAVKNQNPYGTCWAFAIASSMESNALVKGYGAYDLSEYQLAYMCTHAATDGASSEGSPGGANLTLQRGERYEAQTKGPGQCGGAGRR